MQIIVTGGNGFVGSHVLTQLVERGHDVVCFDLSSSSPIASRVEDEVTFVRGDVTDPVQVAAALGEFDPDAVVHLASLLGRGSQRNPRRAFDVNVGGTLTLFELARSHGVDRIVTASSVAAYGTVDESHDRLDETVVQQPDNVYGLTKYAVERLGTTYRSEYGLETAAIEPVHGFGPDRARGNVEDAFVVKAAVSGASLTVPLVEVPVEFVYVEDTARAFVAATLATDLPHDRYLVGTGEHATLADVVERVTDLVPDADLEIGDRRAGDELPEHPRTDTSRIRSDLGWEPSCTIDEAIERYVAWLEDNPEQWSFDPGQVPWES